MSLVWLSRGTDSHDASPLGLSRAKPKSASPLGLSRADDAHDASPCCPRYGLAGLLTLMMRPPLGLSRIADAHDASR